MTEPKNMLIRHAIFHCELFSWYIFLTEYDIFNFVDVSRRSRTASHACMTTCPLSVERLNTAGHVNFFYLKVSFYQYSRRPLASDDIGDDQRIKHSDDDRPGLTRPIYYCTVGLLCLL